MKVNNMEGSTGSSLDPNIAQDIIDTVETKVYPQRWLVLFSFAIIGFFAQVPIVEYSPILSEVQKYFGVTQVQVILLMNLFCVVYVIFAIPMISPTSNYLGFMMISACALEFIGSTLLYLVPRDYIVALCSFCCFGLAQIVVQNAPAEIADRWFPPDQRTLATSLALIIQQLGINYGFIFPAIILRNDERQPEEDTFNQIRFISLTQLIGTGLGLIFCGSFFRGKPDIPPSLSAQSPRLTLKESFKRILKEGRNVLDIITISAFSGVSWSYMAIISIILSSHNLSQIEIGMVGLSYQLIGSVGGFLVSYLFDHQIGRGIKPNYDLWIKCLISSSYISLICFALAFQWLDLIMSCIFSALVGFGMNAYLSIALQSLVEKLYPNSETAITTGMFIFAQIFSFSSCQLINLDCFSEFGLWVMVVLQTPFMINLLFFYKTDFKRTKTERNELNKERDSTT